MVHKKDSRHYNILIVEDNPGDFLLIEDYVLEYIYMPHFVHATSLGDAKKLMTGDSVLRFDLVMLDLTLPDGDGSELIRDMVEICPDCPIIVLTGYTDFEFSVKSLSLGVSDYLLKDELSASSLYKSIIYNIERKKTHSELEESQKRYSNLFHLSPDPTWVYDDESKNFLDVNEAAIRRYGFTEDEFMSMKIHDLEPQVDLVLEATPHLAGWHDIEKAQQKEIFRHRKKCGKVIFVEKKTREILFQGKIAQIMVAHDITERINYIDAIEKQNQRFGEISWIQSHVVRAPIARLMGLISLIKHPASDEQLKLELLGYVLDSAHELDDIVREITHKAEEISLSRDSK
ncbi:response regulator [Daejeonella sp.]|uniref:response regulator n=1 Tax=Daejeonella sp. TaxID=2805397 RepID=UPI0039835734